LILARSGLLCSAAALPSIVAETVSSPADSGQHAGHAAALWGALHLTAGIAAVRSKNLTAAREHVWTHAEPVAQKTGEANPLWTQFGPLNVYVIAAGIETEIGNTTEALSLADRVAPRHRLAGLSEFIDAGRGGSPGFHRCVTSAEDSMVGGFRALRQASNICSH
jgi:hypothetical protein